MLTQGVREGTTEELKGTARRKEQGQGSAVSQSLGRRKFQEEKNNKQCQMMKDIQMAKD